MTKSFLRKLYNHTYENNISTYSYFSQKEEIINISVMKLLTLNNPVLRHCLYLNIIRCKCDDYDFYNPSRKDLFDLIREFDNQIKEFEITKKNIYAIELEQRKKLKLLKPFIKKYKLCDDICGVILSFL